MGGVTVEAIDLLEDVTPDPPATESASAPTAGTPFAPSVDTDAITG
jgi:hypothetical protein